MIIFLVFVMQSTAQLLFAQNLTIEEMCIRDRPLERYASGGTGHGGRCERMHIAPTAVGSRSSGSFYHYFFQSDTVYIKIQKMCIRDRCHTLQ